MRTPKETVLKFYERIRSGTALEEAALFLTELVLAHQVVSAPKTPIFERSPLNYADHVREMMKQYGQFSVTIEEIISEGQKVFVRWRQDGHHCGSLFGEKPTGTPLVQRGSAVYRVEGEQIAEYWIQVDSAGIRAQIDGVLADS